jgi:hypothetical protein
LEAEKLKRIELTSKTGMASSFMKPIGSMFKGFLDGRSNANGGIVRGLGNDQNPTISSKVDLKQKGFLKFDLFNQ